MAKSAPKKSAKPAKELSAYRFSVETKDLLNQLCELHSRNATNMLEVLIKEAASREKIKVKKP
jgi:hypothetical protein